MHKPISLNGITFYHTQGHEVVVEGFALTFYTYRQMEAFIQERKTYWSELLNLELLISPDNNETLIKSDIIRVLELVCDKMDVDYESACSKYQGGEEVEARRVTMGICFDQGLKKITISDALGINHSTALHHIKTLTDRCSVNAPYRKLYLDTKDYVLTRLNGRFKEDGSGEQLKQKS